LRGNRQISASTYQLYFWFRCGDVLVVPVPEIVSVGRVGPKDDPSEDGDKGWYHRFWSGKRKSNPHHVCPRHGCQPLHHSPNLVSSPRVERDSTGLRPVAMHRTSSLLKLGGRGENRTPDFRVQTECVPASTTRPLTKTGVAGLSRTT
jgi:hypothetical protein